MDSGVTILLFDWTWNWSEYLEVASNHTNLAKRWLLRGCKIVAQTDLQSLALDCLVTDN